MALKEEIMPQAMVSPGQTRQSTAHTPLGGTRNSQNHTHGTFQGLSTHRAPTHGSAMACHQPVRQHINAVEFDYVSMLNVQHSGMDVHHGSYPAQYLSYTPYLGSQDHAAFVYHPGQQFHGPSDATVQKHNTMGLSGPFFSQHPGSTPAFGAQACATTPRSFMQISNSGPVQDFVHAHNSVPMENTSVDRSGPIMYNRPRATRPQPPVTYHDFNEALSQPSKLATSHRHTTQKFSIYNEPDRDKESRAIYNKAYLAAKRHRRQGQRSPRSRKGQQDPQGSTTRFNSSTTRLDQGHHHRKQNGSRTPDIIDTLLESPMIFDNRSATIPAETGESINSSGEQLSSLLETTSKVQLRLLDGPSSTRSNNLGDDKLDVPTPHTDNDVPDGSNVPSAQGLFDSQPPDQLSLEFSRFIDRLYPELIFPYDSPPVVCGEDSADFWGISGGD